MSEPKLAPVRTLAELQEAQQAAVGEYNTARQALDAVAPEYQRRKLAAEAALRQVNLLQREIAERTTGAPLHRLTVDACLRHAGLTRNSFSTEVRSRNNLPGRAVLVTLYGREDKEALTQRAVTAMEARGWVVEARLRGGLPYGSLLVYAPDPA
jgi:hypothetical protein